MPCRPSSTCTHYPPTGHMTRERTAVYAMPRPVAGRAGLRNAAQPRSRARLPLGALHAPLTRGSARCVPSMAAAARAQSGASRLAPRRRRGGAGPRRQPAGPGPRVRGARARASRHARGRARGHYICRGARAPRPPWAYRHNLPMADRPLRFAFGLFSGERTGTGGGIAESERSFWQAMYTSWPRPFSPASQRRRSSRWRGR